MNSKKEFEKWTSKEVFEKIVEMKTINDFWDNSVKEYKDEIAIIYDGISHTYTQLDEEIKRFRTVIKNNVKDINDKYIGIKLDNSFNFAKAYLSVVTLGYVAVVLSPDLSDDEIKSMTKDIDMKYIITDSNKCGDFNIIDVNEKSEDMTDAKVVDANECSTIMFTSGSTGEKKGVMLSNIAIMQGVINGCYGYKDVFKQKYVLALPLSHVFGLIRSFLTPLYTGGTIFISKTNKDIFSDSASFNPNIVVTVPAIVELFISLCKNFNKKMLGSELKYIICGAAAVPPYLINECKKLDISLFPGYGLTETANLVSGNPENIKKPKSVGIPYPNQDLRIVDGELQIKGLNVMIGYTNKNNDCFTDDGYFKTGDLAEFDDDGFLYILGRLKELIVLPTGENVAPLELEAKFNTIDYIQDSEVYESRDENNNFVLVLEVLPRLTKIKEDKIDDFKKVIEAEIHRINETLKSYERVSKIIIRDKDFERTKSMKIVRHKSEVK